MGRKKTEEAIADSRAGRVAGRFGSVDELLADLKADDTPENLETWLHEKVGPAYDALKADPARAVTADQVRYTLDELLAEAEASGQYPLPPEQRELVDAPAVGRELLPEDLQTAEAIAAFQAHAEASGDLDYIEHAREVAARARTMHGIAS